MGYVMFAKDSLKTQAINCKSFNRLLKVVVQILFDPKFFILGFKAPQ